MTLQEAIKLLTEYQLWRMGSDDIPMLIPSEITEALDIVLNHIVDTNEMVELPIQEQTLQQITSQSQKLGLYDAEKEYRFKNYNYWVRCLKYWKEEKELAIIGTSFYSNCCARIGVIEDFFKCIKEIPKAKETLYTEEDLIKAMKYASEITNNKMKYMEIYIKSLKQNKQ